MLDQSPMTCRKSVSFCEQARVKRTIHIDDYSDIEIKDCWYSSFDYERMEQEIRRTLELMQTGRGDAIDDVEFSHRGLEFRTEEGKHLRLKNKRRAQDAVLDMQEFQQWEGISDPNKIASVYGECSYPCQVAAYMAGISDLKISRSYDQMQNTEAKKLFKRPSLQNKPSTIRIKLRQLYSSAA